MNTHIDNNGSGEIQLKPTEISSLIKLVENSVRHRLQHGVTLNAVLGATECHIVTDQRLLNEALMNLLVNACQFTTKGAVTFGYEVYEDEIYFFVKDTGVGLTPEYKARLCDLFDENDTESPGLGFGIPNVYNIVCKLGGHMGVESRGTGRGSTFWFTIPYTNETAPTESTDEQQPAATEQEVVKHDRTTILVAEDNDSNYLLFQTVLKRQYDVLHAADGIEAIEMYKKHRPDLIIMDIQMPKLDGYGAVREIRKISPDVPIIAATAYAFVTDRQRLLENGFNGYVSKPINLARLEQEINKCLTC